MVYSLLSHDSKLFYGTSVLHTVTFTLAIYFTLILKLLLSFQQLAHKYGLSLTEHQ